MDWQVYYDAARRCHALADALRAADKPLHEMKSGCAGMAGDSDGCRQWGEKYDQVAQETMQSCTNLADALTNFGFVLFATGYNYGKRAGTNPAPYRPAVQPVAFYRVTIPSSVGNNGSGVDKHDDGLGEFYDQLVGKIGQEFGKLPNGNVNTLQTAADKWKQFAENESVRGAEAEISRITELFDRIQDKTNLPRILERLDALRGSAGQIAIGASTLAGLVGEYHTSTRNARTSFESEINVAVAAAGITVAGALVFAAISFGGSLLAGAGAIGGIVLNCVNAIRTAFQTSNLIKVIGLTAATAGAAVTLKHFNTMPDMTDMVTEGGKLGAIILMKVLVDDAAQEMGDAWKDAPGTAPGNVSITEGRRIHILDGDGDEAGGGHAPGTGAPNKTEFPDSDPWTDDHIIDRIQDVAKNPDQTPVLQDNGRYRVSGVRDGVLIEVIVNPDGSIRTGYPVSGPGVYRNDENGDPIK
ncbi:EndoU domain-containing protein [Nocardia sp. NPDC057353]|uniref:EndoU domain-containing protein n=1 Tax=Nocardia sp. NPDC057353 TaxID=3346104 RepID=UPI00362E053C